MKKTKTKKVKAFAVMYDGEFLSCPTRVNKTKGWELIGVKSIGSYRNMRKLKWGYSLKAKVIPVEIHYKF